MRYLKISGCALAVALAFILATPASHAQSRALSNILMMNEGGAYLGIEMKDVTSEDVSKYKLSSERGVIVSSVIKGSPAETATIKEDDVILEFGGFSVWSSSQMARLVQETPAGRNVDIVVSRDGKRVNLKAKPEDRERRTARRMEVPPHDVPGPMQRFFEFRAPDAPNRQGSAPSSQKPRLGVTLQPLTDQFGEFLGVPGKKGVLVASVVDGSPSAGKLRSGDVITSVNGEAVSDPDELARLVRSSPGGEIKLKVIRDKKEISVVISLPVSEEKGFKL